MKRPFYEAGMWGLGGRGGWDAHWKNGENSFGGDAATSFS